jgi:hypothetical protein
LSRDGSVFAQVASPVTKIDAEAGAAQITVEPLRDHISVLSGSGGSITVFTGPEGKFLVDSGIAVSEEKVAAGIGSPGLNYVVNTHRRGITPTATPGGIAPAPRSRVVDKSPFRLREKGDEK